MTTLLPAFVIAAPIAVTATGAFQFRDVPPRNVTVQANFVYGSGGTSVDAWLQTSLDGGASWIDIAQFHFTTASARFVYNLSSLTPVTTEYAPTDGTLAANTAKDGVIGPHLRVKYTSSGTYAGGTTLQIDVDSQRVTTQAQ